MDQVVVKVEVKHDMFSGLAECAPQRNSPLNTETHFYENNFDAGLALATGEGYRGDV